MGINLVGDFYANYFQLFSKKGFTKGQKCGIMAHNKIKTEELVCQESN